MMATKKLWMVGLALAALALAARPVMAQDCCTDHLACQDGRWCTGIEYCNCWGVCVSGTRPNCNDGDSCTVDNCVDDVIEAAGAGYGIGHCEHVEICGGCADDGDCDDGDVCTTDRCVSHTCVNAVIPGCCETDGDCDDGEVCTDDLCVGGVCQNNPVTNCCHADGDCDDGDVCTNDVCDSSNRCVNTVRPDCCLSDLDCDDSDNCTREHCNLVTNTCVTDWTGTPPTECCNTHADCSNGLDCDGWELCDDVTVPQGVCVDSPDVTCDDTYDCTADACNESLTWCATPPDFCICEHVPTAMYDTCSTAGAMTVSGPGHARAWSASGDTHCSNNDYTPSCGTNGRDNVHTLAVPGDGSTNHQLYAYHAMIEAPAMNPTAYLFPVDDCGGTPGWACNATGVGTCWVGGHAAADSNDACLDTYNWSNTKTVLPEGTYSVMVDSANAAGGDYDLYVTREVVTNDSCDEAVEVQMGGKWYGNTTGHASYGCAFCTETPTTPPMGSSGACSDYTCVTNYAQAEFELDHRAAPWNRAMGYVVQAASVGGFDPSLSLFKNTCFSNLGSNLSSVYGIVCNNDASSTHSASLVTGVIPSGYVGEIRLHGFHEHDSGSYELTVLYDSDGDGLEDALDSWPGSKWGATASPPGDMQDGPIVVSTRPYSDSRSNWGYPNDNLNDHTCVLWLFVCLLWQDTGIGAEETYYKLNVGGSVNVRVSPMAQGGSAWGGTGIPSGWDPVLWYSNDCSTWSFVDAEGNNGPEESAGVSGNGCVAVDGYAAADGGFYLLEVW
jgi:hypothetical protein